MSTGVSRNVKSQMGNLLRSVRQKSGPPEDEYEYYYDRSDPEDLQYDSDYHCEHLDNSSEGKWEVRYDNQNYIRSMVNEDKGFHRAAVYPKHKWEISHTDHAHVRNLAPYPVRVSIDHGDDKAAQWDVPYDNKNYILSMLAGTGVSKAWEEERVNERHGHLQNPYDYRPQKDEVIHSVYKERRPHRESYRFDRMERNGHDYDTEYFHEDEVTRSHPRQRRQSTNIYRVGDVERNGHDYTDSRRSWSPPRRYDQVAEKQRTRYDAINKWKMDVQNSEHEMQNACCEGSERHYNQYGVEASAHDYDENRAIRAARARKRIVPMSLVNVMRKQENGNRRFRQVTDNYRDHLPDMMPVRTDLYERVVDEHKNHPCDYGTTHEDSYEEYVEDDDSRTWVSTSEKYAKIHHRSS